VIDRAKHLPARRHGQRAAGQRRQALAVCGDAALGLAFYAFYDPCEAAVAPRRQTGTPQPPSAPEHAKGHELPGWRSPSPRYRPRASAAGHRGHPLEQSAPQPPLMRPPDGASHTGPGQSCARPGTTVTTSAVAVAPAIDNGPFRGRDGLLALYAEAPRLQPRMKAASAPTPGPSGWAQRMGPADRWGIQEVSPLLAVLGSVPRRRRFGPPFS
jgi:hypothetical protein